MENNEKGYVYGFTVDDFHKLKTLAFAQYFHSVAEEGRTEYQKFVDEFTNEPAGKRPEPRFVRMVAFRVDEETPDLNAKLRKRFPDYSIFFVANRTVHEMFKRVEKFNFLGTIPMTMMNKQCREIL